MTPPNSDEGRRLRAMIELLRLLAKVSVQQKSAFVDRTEYEQAQS